MQEMSQIQAMTTVRTAFWSSHQAAFLSEATGAFDRLCSWITLMPGS